jgi:hypothetical protein
MLLNIKYKHVYYQASGLDAATRTFGRRDDNAC